MWGAIGSIVKMGVGVGQMFGGQAGLAGLERPKYETPREIQEMLALSRMEYADPTMPGENTARDRIAQSSATAYQQASGAGNPFAAIAAIQANQQSGDLNLTAQSGQYNRQDLEAYKQALQTTAQFKDQEFQMNEFAPFAEKSQEFRDMIGAGTKNIVGGISEVGSMADALSYSKSQTSKTGGVDYNALSDALGKYTSAQAQQKNTNMLYSQNTSQATQMRRPEQDPYSQYGGSYDPYGGTYTG
jgi:hypothetical protein